MRVRAYAKINLGLHVIDRRPDGYHDIETVFHQINLYDEIELIPEGKELILHSDAPHIPTDASNLCLRAARLLQDVTGHRDGAQMVLRKRIPVGAGLGGGSSDAAAVFRGLTYLWGLEISTAELTRLAATVGSDIPFFIEGGSAYATGRGEQLQHVELSLPYWILVVTPNIRIATSWAYANLRIDSSRKRENLLFLVRQHLDNPHRLAGRLLNDFEPLVFEHFPEVGRLKDTLCRGGADFALMSGSGSSVFAFFRDEARARELAAALQTVYPTSLTEPNFKPEPIISSV